MHHYHKNFHIAPTDILNLNLNINKPGLALLVFPRNFFSSFQFWNLSTIESYWLVKKAFYHRYFNDSQIHFWLVLYWKLAITHYSWKIKNLSTMKNLMKNVIIIYIPVENKKNCYFRIFWWHENWKWRFDRKTWVVILNPSTVNIRQRYKALEQELNHARCLKAKYLYSLEILFHIFYRL